MYGAGNPSLNHDCQSSRLPFGNRVRFEQGSDNMGCLHPANGLWFVFIVGVINCRSQGVEAKISELKTNDPPAYTSMVMAHKKAMQDQGLLNKEGRRKPGPKNVAAETEPLAELYDL